MDENREFYAWVKTVDDADWVLPPPTCKDEPCEKCRSAFRSGDRPPRAAAVNPNDLDEAQRKEVFRCCDAHHVRLWAPCRKHGEWRVDPIHSGHKGKSFEVMQFIGTRQSAIKWLASLEGKTWSRNAEHLALMKFTGPGGSLRPTSDFTGYAALRGWTQPPFDLDSWRLDFLDAATGREHDSDPWLERCQVARLLEDLTEDLKKLMNQNKDEKPTYHQLTDVQRKKIREQSSDIAAMKAVVAPRDSLRDKPATLELLDRIRRETRALTFQLKWAFGRGRPWEIKNPPELVVQSGEPLFPAHAAFPAGHAVLAYAAAYLLGGSKKYVRRAEEVSQNRVYGGFHWESDLEAGRLVAEAVCRKLADHAKMKELLSRVVAE